MNASISIGFKLKKPESIGFPSDLALHPAKIVAPCETKNAISVDQTHGRPFDGECNIRRTDLIEPG